MAKYLDSNGLSHLWLLLKQKFVPQTRTVNSKALSSDITLTASDVGALPSNTTIPSASSTTPKAPGTAAVGSETAYARGDHVHPKQTTITGNAGTATALATARTIDGVEFDGSASISHFGTTASLIDARVKVITVPSGFNLVNGALLSVLFAEGTNNFSIGQLSLRISGTDIPVNTYMPEAPSNTIIDFVYDASGQTPVFYIVGPIPIVRSGASSGEIEVNGANVTVNGWSSKANLASPTFTGTPKAPTASAGTNTTQIATTAFVNTAVANATSGAATFKGVVNAGTDISSLTAYSSGWYWVVGTAGTYVGEACEAGDMIFCVSDYSSAYSASDFSVVQNNIETITNAEIDTIVAA